jgi:endonuclease/exonuclease/phosphatase family metal-dependent hydrolase
VTSTSAPTLRIVSANMDEGGLDAGGSRARWEHTVEAIGAWSPDVVCVQEMAARRDPRRLRVHSARLSATATNQPGAPSVIPPTTSPRHRNPRLDSA